MAGSTVAGQPYLRGQGRGIRVINSHVGGTAIIEGEAAVVGITLEKQMRISRGIWKRPPRYFEIVEPFVHLGITESVAGFAQIGCRCKEMRRWITGKARFGQAIGWKKETTDLIALKFEEWLDAPLEIN